MISVKVSTWENGNFKKIIIFLMRTRRFKPLKFLSPFLRLRIIFHAAMSSDLPITTARIVADFCSTLFYGVYLVTCTFCARTLFFTGHGQEERWRKPSEIRWLMAVIAVILFCCLTFGVAVHLSHTLFAFVDSDDPAEVLQDVANWYNVAGVCSSL
jgi:fatty acid desaturase